ncbi:DUF4255 domain-containing protein [Amycolatopsis sp. CA-230715]|uniref:DUF4255 domain-containing protein n=1 Tax=Amycolatopsis sp. CA-230715 TaxID=2745196 RepID=UPI001C02722E|nr:DUF4255 domain-containing protein [Amycolatopsis sp. CA-230715]QWF77839.1 hypothetical protein HUW46_01232 [Amycolatopsis sp. CA-230715]
MIHEVDEALRALITDGSWLDSQIEVVFEAPTSEWAARRNAPTVNVFLYDVREDLARRGSGRVAEHDEHGELVGWRPPPRWYDLSYLVTAWTSRAQDEHRLLSTLLAGLSGLENLPQEHLRGSVAEAGFAVSMQTARPLGEGRSLSELWTALGGELKPSVDLLVTAPMVGELTPVGPLVTDSLVLETQDERRTLRYPDPADEAVPTLGAAKPRVRGRMDRIR